MPQQQQPKSNCAIGDLRAAMQSCLETTCDALTHRSKNNEVWPRTNFSTTEWMDNATTAKMNES